MSDDVDAICAQLCRRIETLLNARAEPVALLLLASLPAGACHFRLTGGESGFRVSLSEIAGETCARTASLQELRSVFDGLVAAASDTPMSMTERLAVLLQTLIRKTAACRLPELWRKATLSALCAMHWRCRCRISGAAALHEPLQLALSCLLQEPQCTVQTLSRQHHYFTYYNYARRLMHLRAGSAGDKHFVWPERNAYKAMSRVNNESRLLLTIHMGDFFGAFKCIAAELGDKRSVISLQRAADTEAIKQLSPHVAQRHQVLAHGEENPLQIVRALRAGGKTLAMLFDLGVDYGETAEVKFFGFPARLVRGPAVLALTSKARIYPFVCIAQDGYDLINMEAPLTPELMPGETLQQAADRLTQTLAGIAERWIRQQPAQWKYLHRLPSYLVVDSGAVVDSGVEQGERCHAQ